MSERTPGAIHTSERSDRLARRLRKAPTFAEKQLWKALRKVETLHFRRQTPFGPYVVDFVCHRSRLIVEVDGGIHNLDAVAQRDAEREAWLASRGYRVLRLTNQQALDIEAAVAVIVAEAGVATPTPNPSPQGGGE
ncbi:endonuclease domain-containing protein [Caulobacter sp. KR2-114]|uniref:endonuclease domain-containing protein n=1 Tax=Caulobacter sp. KR2-114 TaxID=3400912 RepID=UPI003C0B297A